MIRQTLRVASCYAYPNIELVGKLVSDILARASGDLQTDFAGSVKIWAKTSLALVCGLNQNCGCTCRVVYSRSGIAHPQDRALTAGDRERKLDNGLI